jgi:hypothetical protein
MTRRFTLPMALAMVLALAAGAAAQQPNDGPATPSKPAAAPAAPATDPPAAPLTKEEEAAKAAENSWKKGRTITMQYFRPQDRRGINVFETTKVPGAEFTGFKLDFNAAFTTQGQNLKHSTKAVPVMVNGVDTNKLATIGSGFNNSTANLSLHAQLAPGIRVALTSYLSSRHHNETWVKDGYLIVDKSPLDIKPLKDIMEYVTLKFGQFEVNYGDQHFRRTDNGQAMYNPFIGNLIMDAMTTEVGGELSFKRNGFLAMAGVTNAESKGLITVPPRRTAAYLGKLAYDKQVNDDLRVRLSGSMYTTSKANNNVLYSGDRAGSRYYYVMENTAATDAAQAWSGQLNPSFGHNVKAFVVNPFVKWQGLEVFANIETSQGHAWTETADRTFRQQAIDALYRFADAKFYLGGRYNKAEGTLLGVSTGDVNITRGQVGGGWYITPNILMKFELVDQKYNKFPSNDIRSGGRFKGFLIEGAVGF